MTPAFDKTQCKGGELQGYTGCLCEYCLSYRELQGRWIVNVKGDCNTYEISVLRENNRHGIASYGWFSDDKRVIASNVHRNFAVIDEYVRDALVRLARDYADKPNAIKESL